MYAREPHAPGAFDAALCVQCGKPLPAGFTGPSCPACFFPGAGSGSLGEIEGELTVAMEGPPGGRFDRGSATAGTVIGPYRLFERLGEGGFGTVWRAEQSEPIRREVALKLIKPGMDSREVVARFEAERQALALMEHPNIAGVIDAGTTAEGLPYFVMELVRGVPITQYCDERRLTVRERLELFIPVCQAVQHAHQKAILHRDLKPSNLLVAEVDGRPVPKVIDFGIAKALGSTAEDVLRGSLARTVEGMVIGTPQYMSPEQAGATPDLDTRSDVYTLGVILYELLCGETPLTRESLRQAAVDEMLWRIREEEAARPSSRLSPVSGVVRARAETRQVAPERISRELRGDLDWITLRALEKERERRYGSAAEFAADIRRHLDDEPVEAGPPSAAYRFGKFVRRNRLAFASGAGLVALLVAGIAVSTWQAVRATRAERLAGANAREAQANYARAEEQRQRADGEAEVAREVNDFLRNDLLRQAGSRAQADEGNEADPNLTVRRALERAADRIGGRFKERPLVEAEIRQTIGVACREVGDHDRAIEQLEAALMLRKLGLGPEHPDTLNSMNNLAEAYKTAGRLAEALPLHEQTLALRKAKLGPEHPETLTSMNNLALAYQTAGRLAEALPLYEQTLALHKAKLGPEHPNTLLSMNNFAKAYQSVGRLDEAETLFREGLEQSRQKNATRPGSDPGSEGMFLHHLADLLRQKNELVEARQLAEEAVTLYQRHPGLPVNEIRHAWNVLASLQEAQGDPDGAKNSRREALRVQKPAR